MNEFKPLVLLRDQMRADLIEAYLARDISLADAAGSMELSRRQCRRLVKRYREAGPEGLINRRRGKPSNYQLKDDLKAQVIKLIRARCRGMSPTGAWRLLNAGLVINSYNSNVYTNLTKLTNLTKPASFISRRTSQRSILRPLIVAIGAMLLGPPSCGRPE